MTPWSLYILAGIFGIYALKAIWDYLWAESMDLVADQHEHIEGDPL